MGRTKAGPLLSQRSTRNPTVPDPWGHASPGQPSESRKWDMEVGSWVCHQPWVAPLYTNSAQPFHLGRVVGGDPLALQDIAMGSVLLPAVEAVSCGLQWRSDLRTDLCNPHDWGERPPGGGDSLSSAWGWYLAVSGCLCLLWPCGNPLLPASPPRSQPAAEPMGEQHCGPSDDAHPLLPGTESQCSHPAPKRPGPG